MNKPLGKCYQPNQFGPGLCDYSAVGRHPETDEPMCAYHMPKEPIPLPFTAEQLLSVTRILPPRRCRPLVLSDYRNRNEGA